MMNDHDRRETRPEKPNTTPRPKEHNAPVNNDKPVPDGEAIAEVGDAVGGPA
jgi:hypothetical protein